MTEPQLQLGPVEQATTPADEQQLYKDSLNVPLPEEEINDYLDGSVDGFTDFTQVAPEKGVMPNDAQLQGAAEIYNMAMATNSTHITPDDVLQMTERDISPMAVSQALEDIKGQTGEVRRAYAYSLIGDPRLQIEAKMDLLRYVDSISDQADVHMVDKAAQSAAATADYTADDEPDAPQAWQQAQEEVVKQPATAQPVTDEAGNYIATEQVYEDLKALYDQADEGESFLDYVEQMTPVGSLPTLNKVMADIYFDLGLTEKNRIGDEARPWMTVGNSFAELRALMKAAEKNPQQRMEIAKVVHRRLKQNTGLFQDQNDLVVMQVLENLFSKELFGQDNFAGATAEMSNEERAAAGQRLEDIRFKLSTQSNLLSEEEVKALKAERDRLVPVVSGVSGSTVADNVFNLADVLFVGSLARTTGRVLRKLPGMLEKMSRTAPETAARNAAAAVMDESGEAAARLGTRPIDLADNFLPSGSDAAVLNRGVNGFAAMTDSLRAQAAALVKQLRPTNLTTEERAKALADITARYSPSILAKSRPVKLHLNQSAVQLNADGSTASVTAIFGATPYRGYASLQRARQASSEAVEEVFGKDAPIEIVTRDKDGGWRVVDPSEPGTLRGEFFQRVKEERSLGAWENYGTIGLMDNAVDKLTLSSGASHWTRGLNIFNDFFYDKISARVRQGSFSNTVWRGMMEPLVNLKTSQKQLLSDIIRKNEGKELSSEAVELLAGGDKAVVEGYRRFNDIGNVAYHLEDQLKRNAYIREGLSDLYQNGQRIGFGKVLPVDEFSTATRRRVFDPSTGKYTQMAGTDIQKLYQKGGSLARMKHPVNGADAGEEALVLIDRTKGGKNLPIPAFGVQARIPGYYPHMYNRNFIVYAVTKNGKRVPKAVSFTAKSARNYVQSQNARLAVVQAKGKAQDIARYEEGFDPAISRGDIYAQHLDEVESGFSQVMFGQRQGGALKELDDMMEEAELDPIAAMLRATEILSARMTKGEMLQNMRLRTWNALHLPENQKFLKPGALTKSYNQLSVDDLVEASPDMAGWKKFNAMLHRIRLMEQSPDFWENVTKGAYRQMAQLSSKLGLKGAEAAAYRGAKSGAGNPVSIGLAWLHRMYISAFAVKQFTLQVLQSLATAGMLSPHRYAQSIYQGMSIIPAVIARTGTLHGNKVAGFVDTMMRPDAFWSKAVGLDKKEFDRLVDVIIERGLIDSVGSNTMVKAAINDAAEQAARRRAKLPRKGVPEAIEKVRDSLGPLAPLTRARTYDQAVFGLLNKAGWEGGERINQILSLLTLYNRDKAKGIAKLADEAYVDDLIGRTAELTGNMVKEAGFGYTNSVLKPMMLWVPFQHKMIMQAVPKKFGGMQRFTGEEKARMVFGQFLLYGANATAMTAAVHQVIERGIVEKLEGAPEGEKNAFVQFWRDNLSKDVLEGLVFDYLGNKTMMALWGNDADDPKDMAWGRAFAPGAGHDFVREKLTALASADWKGALGVQGNYYGKMARYLNDVTNVVTARMNDMDDMPFEERMKQMTQRGLIDTVPIYGKWVAAKWASKHGMFISENGTVSEPFGDAIEVKLSWLLGVDSKDRAAYYEATDRLRMEFEDEGKAKQAGKSIADVYKTQLVAHAVKLNREASTDEMWQNAMDQWLLDQGLMLSVLGPRELEVFNSEIERWIDGLAAGQGDSAELLMMEKFSNKLREGGYGDKGPTAAVYFRHLPFVQKNPQFLDMLESAWEEIAYEPIPENITEDITEGEE